MRTLITLAATCLFFTTTVPASAQRQAGFDFTGGPAWQLRTGPGVMLSLGGNTCLRDHCDELLPGKQGNDPEYQAREIQCPRNIEQRCQPICCH